MGKESFKKEGGKIRKEDGREGRGSDATCCRKVTNDKDGKVLTFGSSETDRFSEEYIGEVGLAFLWPP